MLPFGLVYCDLLSTSAVTGEDTVDREIRAGAEAPPGKAGSGSPNFDGWPNHDHFHHSTLAARGPARRSPGPRVAAAANEQIDAALEAGDITEEDAENLRRWVGRREAELGASVLAGCLTLPTGSCNPHP